MDPHARFAATFEIAVDRASIGHLEAKWGTC
jgi:hypothetical protein